MTILERSAISSSAPKNNNVLCSGNDGVYDVSFFAASIRHTIGHSRSVFDKLTGASLATFSKVWPTLADDERRAFLLEHHEFAHHALMFSTPAGVLNWRMNQVISRDVQWILLKCHEYGVRFPEQAQPQQVLSTRKWKIDFKKRADVDRRTKRELFRTIEGLEDVLLLRRILFEPGAPSHFAELTFGEMRSLLRRTFAYLESRCEVRLHRDWRTRLPLDTKVFPPARSFNLVDIAEVHAIAMELFVLRALGDTDAVHERAKRAQRGPHGLAFGLAVEWSKSVNELGLSPHQMQILALLAFATAIDVAPKDAEPVYLEDALPWWRFASEPEITNKIFGDALKNCMTLAAESLVGPGSRWLELADIDWPSLRQPTPAKIEAVMKTLGSLGLDRQINAIHDGARRNWRYLATQLEISLGERLEIDFERLTPEAWRGGLQTAVLLVEYKDGLHFTEADFDELYPKGSKHRDTFRHLDSYAPAALQVVGQLLCGAMPRIMYASYTGCLVPALSILEPKLANYLQSSSLAKNMISILSMILEQGIASAQNDLTLVPETVRLERYI